MFARTVALIFVVTFIIAMGGCTTTDTPAPKAAVVKPVKKEKPAVLRPSIHTDQQQPTNFVDAAHKQKYPATRGIRNNNQGNIENGSWAKKQPGYSGSDGRFAKFSTPAHGIAAIEALLDTYRRQHGLVTVKQIVSRWAPPSENNTAAYAGYVAKQVGVGVNDKLNLDDASVRQKLVRAIVKYENAGGGL